MKVYLLRLKKDIEFRDNRINDGNWYVKETTSYPMKEYTQNKNQARLFRSKTSALMSAFISEINIAHNYAVWENHYGKNVIVHRKGATLAREGTIGIIPGSQGSKSYIVKGLGNKESFESCSHGAGRRMGRNEAIKTLDLKTEIENMEKKGIVHGIRTNKDLQEAAGAYKDIYVVMESQKDLVEILVELEPMAVIKADD